MQQNQQPGCGPALSHEIVRSQAAVHRTEAATLLLGMLEEGGILKGCWDVVKPHIENKGHVLPHHQAETICRSAWRPASRVATVQF